MNEENKPVITGEYVRRTYCHKCENKTFEEKEPGDLCPQCKEPLKSKLFRLHDDLELGRLGQTPGMKSEVLI
jgi:hypothetical protein